MLEYISAPEAVKKWGISERPKFSRLWLIPKDAEKPADACTKARRTEKHE